MYFANNMTVYVFFTNWPWQTLHFLTKSMDFVPSILFQYSVIDNEVYDLLKVNMRIEKCEEGTEWTEQGGRHFYFILFFTFHFLLIPPYCTCILFIFSFSLFTWSSNSVMTSKEALSYLFVSQQYTANTYIPGSSDQS